MVRGNFKPFFAKQVDSFAFGDTAFTEEQMNSTTLSTKSSFATNNATPLLDISQKTTLDDLNPTKTDCFSKDLKITGGKRTISKEDLLGHDAQGSQCQELSADTVDMISVETTLVYRNNVPTSIFNDNTKACLIRMDNSESPTTGELNLAFNNIIMGESGELERNTEGLMQHKIMFSIRGGLAGDVISVTQSTPAETWSKVRKGQDYIEEIRTT